jgi:hypothetical protein
LKGSCHGFDLREPGFVENIPANQQSLYLYNDTWLTWPTDVDVVRGPIVADEFDRIYYTGDGAPKVLGTDGGAPEVYDLGIPSPTTAPTIEAQTKPEGGYTRAWNFFYEEPDGRQVDQGTMVEGVDVIELEVGIEYEVTDFETKFPKNDASPDAVFVMWFEGTDTANGSNLGRVYGSISSYTSNNDFVLQGAAATAEQVNEMDDATFTLTFDTSHASEYTVDRAYLYTFVSEWGEEGPPSPASEVVAIEPTQDAFLSDLEDAPAGDYQITSKRIYRTVTGASGQATFQFVAEIDIATGTYLDTLRDEQTAEALPSLGWDTPPDDLIGIVSMANGFFAAFKAGGKDVYFSEPNHPHAWPSEYIISVDYPIVGLGSHENSLLIATEGFPYLATGVTPEFMTLQRLLNRMSCVSKRSIVNVGGAIVYASSDGIVLNVGADITMLTKPYYTEEEWREVLPETMIGSFEDERLFVFSDNTTLIFDLDAQRSLLVSNDVRIEGAYNDIESDTLYMIQGSTITDWEGGSETKNLRWRSKRFVFNRVSDFTTGRILSDGYPVTFRLFAEGAEVHEQTVPDDESFSIPTLRQEREWNVEVETQYNVTELVLADRRGLAV